MKRIFLSITLLTFNAFVFAQNGILQGHVLSDTLPVAYANISISKTSFGISTDQNGNYEIKHIPPGRYAVIISAIGYETKNIPVTINANEITIFNVQMREAFFSLNAIVITGTRTEKRKLESPVAVNILDSKTF